MQQLKYFSRQKGFNSRPHVRGDTPRKINKQLFKSFNSRPHVRGDKFTIHQITKITLFQFTPPRKGRPRSSPTAFVCLSFQFTPPRKGRRSLLLRRSAALCFNSRPHVRGDLTQNEVAEYLGMFQFTPPRKGRQQRGFTENLKKGFQFTPPRKGRQSAHCKIGALERFNSRPHVRGDICVFALHNCTYVSIHAPT